MSSVYVCAGMGEYTGDGGQPYCSSCYDRLTKERYGKNTAAGTATTAPAGTTGTSGTAFPSPKPPSSVSFGGLSSDHNSNDNFQSFELSDDFTKPKQPSAADKFRNLGASGSGTKKCPICSKTVYQAEEMVCLKQSWHKECFTCGGNQGKGCKRRLGHGEAHGKC